MKPNSENSKIPIRNQKSQMNLQRGRVKKKKKTKNIDTKNQKVQKNERKSLIHPSLIYIGTGSRVGNCPYIAGPF